MKTLLKQIAEALAEILESSGVKGIPLINSKLDHILLNQEALAAYLGMSPAGATPEELDALAARIKASKEAIQKFGQSTTTE